MKNTMQSVIKHVIDNFAVFGLSSVTESKFIESPKSQLTDGGKWLTLLAMQTLPGIYKGPYVMPDVNERFMTQVEIECKMRASDPSKDFPWNGLWGFRDKVYSALAGAGETGVVITRYDFTDPENPVEDGKIWFEVDRDAGAPMERTLEDPNDPANKSIFLTYNVHWWKASAETAPTDPWLEALCAWTEDILGGIWAVHRGALLLGYTRPAVMWRVTGAEVQDKTSSVYEVRKRFAGHILGGTPNQQLNTVLALNQELKSLIKIPLNVVERRYMKVVGLSANVQADAFSAGQLSVTLSRLTSRPADEVPLMMHVEGQGNLS